MKAFIILLKREYWEHRGAFFVLPAVVTAMSIAIMILLSIAVSTGMVSINGEWDEGDESMAFDIGPGESTMMEFIGPEIEAFAATSAMAKVNFFDEVLVGNSIVLFFILWFVVFFYLMGSLYEERKDRSILFWKSLPVSDGLTVLSKLVSGLIVAPVIYLGFVACIHIALLICASMLALPYEVSIWQTIWAPSGLISRWIGFSGYILFSAIWCSAFFGWLMLVSSWAKSVPLAWVAGPPVLIVILERLFSNQTMVGDFIQRHVLLSTDRFNFSLDSIVGMFSSLELLVSLVLGSIFIGLAIFMRGKANEI